MNLKIQWNVVVLMQLNQIFIKLITQTQKLIIMTIIPMYGKKIENVTSITISLDNDVFYFEVIGQPEGEILIDEVKEIIA
jgi:hypothetical protein